MFEDKEYAWIQAHFGGMFTSRLAIFKIKSSPWATVYLLRPHSGNDHVLKIGLLPIDGGGIENERKALHFLKSKGVVVLPKLYKDGKIGQFSFILMPFLKPGRSVSASEAGSVFADIHRVTLRRGNDHLDFASGLLAALRLISRYLEFSGYPRQITREINALIDDYSALVKTKEAWFRHSKRQSFINADNQGNLARDRGKVIILDWHLARFGDPAWDVARLLAYYKFSPASFFEAYLRKTDTDQYLRQRAEIYLLINEMVKVALFTTNSDTYRMNPFSLIMDNQDECSALNRLLYHKISSKISRLRRKVGIFGQ